MAGPRERVRCHRTHFKWAYSRKVPNHVGDVEALAGLVDGCDWRTAVHRAVRLRSDSQSAGRLDRLRGWRIARGCRLVEPVESHQSDFRMGRSRSWSTTVRCTVGVRVHGPDANWRTAPGLLASWPWCSTAPSCSMSVAASAWLLSAEFCRRLERAWLPSTSGPVRCKTPTSHCPPRRVPSARLCVDSSSRRTPRRSAGRSALPLRHRVPFHNLVNYLLLGLAKRMSNSRISARSPGLRASASSSVVASTSAAEARPSLADTVLVASF
jgi:hypothetical protein